MAYRNRLTDNELQRKLDSSGAVLIRGPKSCGKTESAMRFAGSVLRVDIDENVRDAIKTAPKRLLLGKTPRLIDEWQVQPDLWNHVRHEIDERKQTAQFILTGSANPEETAKLHSGAGRFTTLNMRTMSWQELGVSSGRISMKELFKGAKIDICDEPAELEFIVDKLIIGGFPTLLEKRADQAADLNRAYIDLLAEADMSRVSNVKRDPLKVRDLLRSIARNTATPAEITTLAADIHEKEDNNISRPTVYDYLDALNRLMIIEDQPAWNTHIRSSASLRKTPKRHLADVSLAAAALGADAETLLNDIRFTGFLFESLVTHELRVYAQANDADVYYYRDTSGLEVDAIVQKRNGDWIAFETKLGAGQIEEAAENLKKMAALIDTDKVKPPKSLNVVTGTGISYTRNDGVNVVALGSLGG